MNTAHFALASALLLAAAPTAAQSIYSRGSSSSGYLTEAERVRATEIAKIQAREQMKAEADRRKLKATGLSERQCRDAGYKWNSVWYTCS